MSPSQGEGRGFDSLPPLLLTTHNNMKNTYLLIILLIVIAFFGVSSKFFRNQKPITTVIKSSVITTHISKNFLKPTITPIDQELFGNEIALSVSQPADKSSVTSQNIVISGKTVPDADVFVNANNVNVDSSGIFSTNISLSEGENNIFIDSNDATGNTNEKIISVNYLPTIESTSAIYLPNVKVVALGLSSISVNNNSATVVISPNSQTIFKNNFWDQIQFQKISIGDLLSVYGLWDDATHTKINTSFIRDDSITTRTAVVYGVVERSNVNTMEIATRTLGNTSVLISSSIIYYNLQNKIILYNQLEKNDKVRVSGVLDAANHQISAVMNIKDFAR